MDGPEADKSHIELKLKFVSSEQRFQTEMTKFTHIRINCLNGPSRYRDYYYFTWLWPDDVTTEKYKMC